MTPEEYKALPHADKVEHLEGVCTELETKVKTSEDAQLALETEVETLKKQIEDTPSDDSDQVSTLKTTVQELSQKLAITEKKAAKVTLTVTHNKKDYDIVAGRFNYKAKGDTERKIYTAEDLMDNEGLVAELVEMESGVLKLKD